MNKKSTAEAVLLNLIVCFTELSLEELNNFNNGDDENRKSESDSVFHDVEMSKLKCLGKEINFNNLMTIL